MNVTEKQAETVNEYFCPSCRSEKEKETGVELCHICSLPKYVYCMSTEARITVNPAKTEP